MENVPGVRLVAASTADDSSVAEALFALTGWPRPRKSRRRWALVLLALAVVSLEGGARQHARQTTDERPPCS